MQAMLRAASTPRDRLWLSTAIALALQALYGYLLEGNLLILFYRAVVAASLNSARMASRSTLVSRIVVLNLLPVAFHLFTTPGTPADSLLLSFVGPGHPPSRFGLLLLDLLTGSLHYLFALAVIYPKAQAALAASAVASVRGGSHGGSSSRRRTGHSVLDAESDNGADSLAVLGYALPGASASAAAAAAAAGVFADDSSDAADAALASRPDIAELVSAPGLDFSGNNLL
ncbi:uncharacterized protein AMSG_02755 [Thecamonas trahens ATCC 50062]|uniref:DUF1746 domain-containing protein n=1 Tax=Thecamonas trahens ATCC 50062 TaxID=461836 RepID=A0A0L0D4R9_THETB|nr:hypothetical protein AMSG_02755 [Thecamonas trahens ATCC 50062]KNC46303.1 hypothetical protein AMSG_02755 [Thecamonas trahens ATCC 50062]|eukprot:XP_013760596.1 hypothetical protein AMSG_02755 [Thecamonas trahens ATCC 50062]